MDRSRLSPAARLLSLLVAVTAWAGLGAQAAASAGLLDLRGPALLWHLAGYFTLLTAALVALAFTRASLTGRPLSPGWHGGLAAWSLVAGLVYHAVLAGLWVPRGLGWWADRALHDALPTLVLLHWLLAARSPLGLRHALAWLLWPAAYAAFVLARGAATGAWPYPFLDLDALGPALLLRNVALLGLTFLVAGLALVALSRRPAAPVLALPRLQPPAGPGSAPQ